MVTSEQVELAYRLMLGRRPESPGIAERLLKSRATTEDLARMILLSPEFGERLRSLDVRSPHADLEPDDLALLESFGVYAGPGKEGYVTNFLGVRTDVRFMPSLPSGGIEGLPVPSNFHGDAREWIGTLKAVDEARERFVAIELGAGWAPWLVSSWKACRIRGVARVDLVGVEADPGKLEFMRTHFADNGIDPDDHTLLLGIAGAEDGKAYFPVAEDPAEDWGAAALKSRTGPEATDYRGLEVGRVVEVEAYSVASLLQPFPAVDLLHCDIQGQEHEVLSTCRDELRGKVRRLIIGSHSRRIEGGLLEMLSEDGWLLEHEKPCIFHQEPGKLRLQIDGCQVWRNDGVDNR